MAALATLKSRVKRPSSLNRFAKPEDLLDHFPNGAYIGWSGFTGVGYPKYLPFLPSRTSPGRQANTHDRKTPAALADHVERNNLQGKLRYSLFVGASSGAETENRWAKLDMIHRRSPHQVGREIAAGINGGRIEFFDKHLGMFPSDLVYVSSIYITWGVYVWGRRERLTK